MDSNSLLERIFFVVPLILSLSVHEWAHAATAVYLGDDTPIRQGRYTLNPLPHIDPVGTLLLPLLGVPFGWAKPVEWNPARIRRGTSMQRAQWMVSLAGPASNLVLAALACGLLAAVAPGARFVLLLIQDRDTIPNAIEMLLLTFFGMNVGLAVFNMLPIPPLDGSRIVEANLPRSMEDWWHSAKTIAPFLLIAFFFFDAPRDVLFQMIGFVSRTIAEIVLRIRGL